MTHPEDQLADYVDGSLDPRERAVVDAHLAECSTCRDEIAVATTARAALETLPRSVGTPPDVGGRAIDEARRGPERSTRTGTAAAPDHSRWYRWAGAAAGAAAVALALVLAVPALTGDGDDRPAELAIGDAGAAAPSSATGTDEVERIAGNLTAKDLPTLAGPILADVQEGRLALDAAAGGQPDATAGQEAAEAPNSETISSPDSRGTAVTCLRSAFPPVTTEPLRIAQLRFDGTPAYAGVFYVPGGTVTEFGTFEADVLQVVVASREDCTLLATSPVRV